MRDRLLVLATVLGAAVFVSQMLSPFAIIPQVDMNASRITPAVALAKGFSLYAGRSDGAVIDFMYGPMAAITFLPAALASGPSAALLIAGVVNVLVFFVPMAWLFARAGLPGAVAATAFVCFAMLAARDPGLAFSAFTIHADAPALGLCAAACLAHLRKAPLLASACAVLAVWTKQPTAPIVLALPLHALLVDGRRHAARTSLGLAAVGVLTSLLFVLVFGYADMVFNMFTLPGQQPWYGQAEHGKLGAALASLRLLVFQNRWSMAAIVLLAVVGARQSAWGMGRDGWPLLALVGLLMVPSAILGGAKVGGFLNTQSFANYFLLGAATLGLGELAVRARGARIVLLVLALALAAWALNDPQHHRAVRIALTRLDGWRTNPQQQAYDFASAHPGEVYFPWNPLASLQAEGRLDHSMIGTFNRELVGIPMQEDHLRRYLPPAMRLLAYRAPIGAQTWLPLPNQRLPEFRDKVSVAGLEGWIVYRRSGSPETP